MSYKLINQQLTTTTTVAGVQTRIAVSKSFHISTADALRMTVDVISSASTLDSGTFSFFLESSLDDGVTWDFTALATVAITTVAGRAVWTMQFNNAASGTLLRPTCRVVLTSAHANNTITISSVNVSNRTGYQS